MTTEAIPIAHQGAMLPAAAPAVGIEKVPSRFGGLSVRRIIPMLSIFLAMITSMIGSASALEINWTPMLDLLDSVGGTVLPELFEFFLAIAPYIVAFAVVMMILRFIGALVGFFEQIFRIF